MNISNYAKEVFDAIIKAGGQVYIVGGSVRDFLMKKEVGHDIDVEVYHLTYQQLYDVLSRFGKVNTFGKSFAIMQLENLPHYDFALPRMEEKNGHKHQDFNIFVDPFLPLSQAILRRDLTMNALMYDYQKNQILDFCQGKKDIEEKIIRCVNEKTFIEDPLRVLRIAQFIARFEMKVEEKTKQLCQQMVQNHLLDHLSNERVYQEYCKILMSNKPSLGFYFLKEIGALPPYLDNLTKTKQRLDYHPEGDVFTHTMLVVDMGALSRYKVDEPLLFMWSCLLHDIGKPLVTTDEGHAPRHNEAGVDVFKSVSLIQSKRARRYISTMIYYHMHLMNMCRNHASDYKYLRLLKEIEGKISLNDLIWLSCCDKLGRGRLAYEQYNEFIDYINDKKERLSSHALEPLVTGKDLVDEGIHQNSQFKEILNEAYDLQLQGISKEKILRSLRKKYE